MVEKFEHIKGTGIRTFLNKRTSPKYSRTFEHILKGTGTSENNIFGDVWKILLKEQAFQLMAFKNIFYNE